MVRKSASPSKSLEPRRLVLDGGIPEEEAENSGPAFKKLRKAAALFVVDGTCVMTMTAKESETIPLRFRLRQG